MSSERLERVFLVRLWRDGHVEAPRAWRGSVHDVSLGLRRYVSAPGEIAEFVTASLAAADDNISAGGHAEHAGDADQHAPDPAERRCDGRPFERADNLDEPDHDARHDSDQAAPRAQCDVSAQDHALDVDAQRSRERPPTS